MDFDFLIGVKKIFYKYPPPSKPMRQKSLQIPPLQKCEKNFSQLSSFVKSLCNYSQSVGPQFKSCIARPWKIFELAEIIF